MTIEECGRELGISPAYAGILKRTYDGIKDVVVPAGHVANNVSKNKDVKLLDVWRAESVKPTKEDMVSKVAELTVKGPNGEKTPATVEQKLAAYVTVSKRKAEGEDGTPETRGKSWDVNARDVHAPKIGAMLGNLVRDGAIAGHVVIEGKHVAACLAVVGKSVPDKADDKLAEKLDSISVAIMKGYEAGLLAAIVPPPDPKIAEKAAAKAAKDEEKAAAKAAKDAEKAANGKGGTATAAS